MTFRLQSRLAAALAAMAVAAPTPVFAHGNNPHDPTGPAIKEQKPWGIAGEATSVRRTIRVSMGDDMRFIPSRITVQHGETLRITVRNTGRLLHEFVIGTRSANKAHAALMLKFPGMRHDEPYMVHVPPGQTGELVWTFNRAGTFEFACLMAGHYQAGMVGTLIVAAMKGHGRQP